MIFEGAMWLIFPISLILLKFVRVVGVLMNEIVVNHEISQLYQH